MNQPRFFFNTVHFSRKENKCGGKREMVNSCVKQGEVYWAEREIRKRGV